MARARKVAQTGPAKAEKRGARAKTAVGTGRRAAGKRSSARGRSPGGANKYIYGFGGGRADGRADMKNLLGGKGANLA